MIVKVRTRCYHNKRDCENCQSLYRCLDLAMKKTAKLKMNKDGIFILTTKLNIQKTSKGRVRKRWTTYC